jgi:hypothetical protein
MTAAKRYMRGQTHLGVCSHEEVGEHRAYLRVIISITGVQGDGLQVQSAVNVDCGNDILELRCDAFDRGNMMLLEGKGGGSGVYSRR